jgi:hypothetical protein
MSNDVVVNPVAFVPTGPGVKVQYPHLIKLRDVVGSKVIYSVFLTTEQPNIENNYVKVKGVFLDGDDTGLLSKLNEIMGNINKSDIVEVVLPWNRIDHIKNLLFKAK